MAYTDAPSDAIFNEIKEAAVEIWMTYDNTYGYVDEKVNYIDKIKNVKDNWGTIVGMFDYSNQQKLLRKLSPEAKAKVN